MTARANPTPNTTSGTPDPSIPADSPDAISALVRAASAGDPDAWKELVAAYTPRIFGLIYARCRNQSTAEEITQSVFATLATTLTQADRPYREEGKFEPWLFRIALNRLRDELRRQKRRPVATNPESFPRLAETTHAQTDPDHIAAQEASAERRALRDALGQLGDADRQVIELRHHAQMSFQQIAEVLQQPTGTVLARHHRALKKLRSIIESPVHSDASQSPAGGHP